MSILRADSIRDRAGTGAPDFPNGATVTGVVTATSFAGNVTGNVTGNTSGTAGGLTGTPNITVGTVTGTDATFSGNLTVQGTTTTIDTAVTAVDSLAVDGNINAASVGIGTTSPTTLLEVRAGGGEENVIRVRTPDTVGITTQSLNIGVNTAVGGSFVFESFNNALRLGTNDLERVRIPNTGGLRFAGGVLEEKFEQRTGDVGDDASFNVLNGNVLKYTGAANASGARSINIRGSGSVAYNDITEIGHAVSLTVIHRPNGNDYINGYNVDGNTNGQNGYSITTSWLGGSAPSSASSSAYEVHNLTVFKGADKNYHIMISVSEYA